jgi:UDP-N-acetyl-D-galactosamine dehydrogenase
MIILQLQENGMQSVFAKLESKAAPIGVVGLGYVGLPLACLLASKYKVVGFDINTTRIAELKNGHDRTKEVEDEGKLLQANLTYTADANALAQCPFIIVAVPTPIDSFKVPDLTPVVSASKTIGSVMKPGTVVVYESTVYPGVTEVECRKVLESTSKMTYKKDFFLGYSPERVNPGDKLHTIDKIVKVVSGCTPEVLDLVATVYGSVITAGVHRAPSLATAEAAKVIENTQRDLNIALVNELSRIFEKIGLDTHDVLEAAGTKWNFLPFKPGLVGGHCIGVDPYYLTHLAQGVGYNPQVILAGRRINDTQGKFVADKTIKMILSGGKVPQSGIHVGILGVTFKEDVPDLRNTKVIDVLESLEEFGVKTYAVDPVADPEEFHEEYGRQLTTWEKLPKCNALVVAVKHKEFKTLGLKPLQEKLYDNSCPIIDVGAIFSRDEAKKLGMRIGRI